MDVDIEEERPLKSIFYTAPEDYERIYQMRSDSPESVKSGISINSYPLFFHFSVPLVRRLEEILVKDREVLSLIGILPKAASIAYLRALISEQVVASNAIEGVHSSRKDVQDVMSESRVKIGQRYGFTIDLLKALRNGKAQEFPSTVEEIRALYDKVVAGEITKDNALDGELFRAGPVHVMSPAQKIVHSGFLPESKIISSLRMMIDELNNSPGSQLAAAIFAHVVFEIIHPFYDGNGRVGRLLLISSLDKLVTPFTALTLSAMIYEHREKYYQGFKLVQDPRSRGEATSFITMIMDFILKAQSRITDDLKTRHKDLKAAKAVLKSAKHWSERQRKILFILYQARIFGNEIGLDLEEITAYVTDGSKAGIRRALAELESAGLVDILRRRPLFFQLSEAGEDLLGYALE